MRGGLTKKQIAACIKQMSGKYAPQVVFADWIQCVALSISNSMQIFHDNLWKQREEQYLATMNRYGKEERMKMAEMAGMLVQQRFVCGIKTTDGRFIGWLRRF